LKLEGRLGKRERKRKGRRGGSWEVGCCCCVFFREELGQGLLLLLLLFDIFWVVVAPQWEDRYGLK
jgi:hypothetical protein